MAGTGRERTLKTLHDAATDIQGCATVRAACERTVAAAEQVLDLDMCSVILHDDGWLEPVALSSGAPDDGARRMRPDQGLAGKTFQSGEPTVVDEIRPDDETDPAKESYRSGMSVPIGDAGVFQAVSVEPHAFDGGDVEYVELLVAHTASAIDRIRFERTLQDRQATLQRQNERLEGFVDVVSHDLRNPLSVAVGELERAREEHDSDHLERVAEQHERMGSLIEDLLTLAREGRPVEEFESVDLASSARACWRHVRTAGVAVEVDTRRTIRADPNRLRQLLENLFRNAVEHGGTGVTVALGDLDGGFYVEDDGPGIPPDEREAVLEKGYSTSEGGTGFGLAIVREIVDAHDWTVAVTESDAGGARFEITGVAFA